MTPRLAGRRSAARRLFPHADVLAALFLLWAVTKAEASPAPAADAAVCPVCRIREGTTHSETVRARRTAHGVSYAFCSEACAEDFDHDPDRYLATADSLLAHPAEAPRGSGLFQDPIPSTTPT